MLNSYHVVNEHNEIVFKVLFQFTNTKVYFILLSTVGPERTAAR